MRGIVLGAALLLGAAAGPSGVALSAGVFGVGLAGWGKRAAWLVLLVPLALLGAARVHPHAVEPISSTEAAEWLDVVVVSGPLESADRQRFEAILPGGDRLCVTAPVAPALLYGDTIAILGRLRGLNDQDERGRGFLESRGCGGSVAASELALVERGDGVRASLDRFRRAITVGLHRVAPGDTGALMSGLVTGDDAALTRRSRDAFIDTGTSHVTAVSGSNLALIAAMLGIGGLALGRLRSGWWQAGTLAALWLYVAMIGAAPPAFRAAMVASLAVIALRLGRRPDLVTISVLVAAAEILVRPADFATLSYRLSTASAIALVLGLTGRSLHGVLAWLRAGIVTTVITQVATAPLIVPVFGRVSLIAVPANLVVAPLCAAAFPFALIAGLAGVVSDDLAVVVGAPGLLLSMAALRAATWFAAVPGADGGGAIASGLPLWLISALSVGIVVAMSRECRGGIARRWRGLRALTGRPLAALAGGTGGLCAGAILAVVLR